MGMRQVLGRRLFHAGVLASCCRLLCALVSAKRSGNSMKWTPGFPAGFPPPPPSTATGIDREEIRALSGEPSAQAVVEEILKLR